MTINTYKVVHDGDAENPRDWGSLDVMYCKHGRYTMGDKHADNPHVERRIYLLDDTEDGNDGNKYKLVSDDYDILPLSMDKVYDMLQAHAYDLKRQLEADPDNESLQADAARAMDAYEYIHYLYAWAEDADVVLRPDIAICLPIYMYDHSGVTISHAPFSCPWDSGQLGWHYMTKDTLEKEFGGDKQRAEEYMDAQLKIYDDYLTGNVWAFVIFDDEGDMVDSCGGFYGDDAIDNMLGHVDPGHHEGLRRAWENRYDY